VDEETRTAVEILANVLYLIKHHAGDRTMVSELVKQAEAPMDRLRTLAARVRQKGDD